MMSMKITATMMTRILFPLLTLPLKKKRYKINIRMTYNASKQSEGVLNEQTQL